MVHICRALLMIHRALLWNMHRALLLVQMCRALLMRLRGFFQNIYFERMYIGLFCSGVGSFVTLHRAL